jgi:alkylation response protein AidB-like acyl-CoA dehydrogenase
MNPWAKQVMGGFNWGGQPLQKPAPAGKEDDDKEDGQPQPAPRQRAHAAPAVHAPEPQPNMFQEHAAMQADMYGATNAAWQKENDSRVEQAREASQRQHEYEMELLRQQGEAQRAQMAPESPYGGQPTDAARQARNRSLLAMAGLGGHTVHSDGHGNTTAWPHPFQSPISRSLLG